MDYPSTNNERRTVDRTLFVLRLSSFVPLIKLFKQALRQFLFFGMQSPVDRSRDHWRLTNVYPSEREAGYPLGVAFALG
jgi:hypothetical protein